MITVDATSVSIIPNHLFEVSFLTSVAKSLNSFSSSGNFLWSWQDENISSVVKPSYEIKSVN